MGFLIKNIMEEIFKDIKGYEGLYQISNLGKVKSLPKKQKNRYTTYYSKEKILTSNVGYGGYKFQKIGNKTFSIHRLVCEYFVNKVDNKNIVNHKDLNKINNNFDNLEWVTSRENTHHYEKTKIGSSRYIGVSFDKKRKKWIAKIKINGETVNLGRFINEIDAHFAYQNKLNKIQYGIKTSN